MKEKRNEIKVGERQAEAGVEDDADAVVDARARWQRKALGTDAVARQRDVKGNATWTVDAYGFEDGVAKEGGRREHGR